MHTPIRPPIVKPSQVQAQAKLPLRILPRHVLPYPRHLRGPWTSFLHLLLSNSRNLHSIPKSKASAMASPNLLLITLFLLLCPAFTPPSTSASASSDRVALDLYYESLCPYSANFIVNHLFNIFRNGIISIVRLHLVPWGNARIRGNDTFVCQHGALECLLNTVEACAIETWPDLNKHFSVLFCIEDLVYRRMSSQWEDCFDKLGLDLSPVAECCNSGLGKELELQYAAETNALQPPHEYVPWVVVDGQPLYEDYENFMSYICKAYKGTDVPKACSEVTLSIGRAGPSLPAVCYREEEEEEEEVVGSKSILSRIK